MVQEVLVAGDLTLADVNALTFGHGPSSFNGIRIGIDTVRGLVLGASLPMIGVFTLMTMAQNVWHKSGATRVLTTIDTRVDEIYWVEYQRDNNDSWHDEEAETVLTPE